MSVKRKIHFFRLRTWTDDGREDTPFTVMRNCLREISDMPHADGGRYLAYYEHHLTMQPRIVGADFVGGKFGYRRMTGLPLIERAGNERPVTLDEDEGLFEPTHFLVFPPHFLAMEYNHHGPRAAALEKYIPGVCDTVTTLRVNFLVRNEAERVVEHLGEIHSINMVARAEMVDNLESLDESLYGAFDAARRAAAGSKVVHMEWKRDGYNRSAQLQPTFVDGLVGWLQRVQNRDTFNKLEIKGKLDEGHRAEVFNLLEDKLVREVRVIRQDPRSRAIDSQSMYEAIVESFEAVRHELDRFV